jgi:tRNA threonylcarbamoyl adenosine modification protein (Sua5/YciO/YrdC/YwlC family)
MFDLSSINDPQLPEFLKAGKVGVIPTDTIYGLAACADNPHAVAKIGILKGHGKKAGTVIAASVQQLLDLGIDDTILQKVNHLWPNPLSIELPIPEKLSYLYQEGAHRAFRVVADNSIKKFLEKTGPLLTSSANLHGEPAATSIAEAKNYFGSKADFYVEGGDLSKNAPSTIARMLPGGKLEIIREGAVKINESGEIRNDI